jgi:hypothetical protein
MNKNPNTEIQKRFIFTNHVNGQVGDFHHIIAANPTLAIRQLIAKHGIAPYKILAITSV